MKFFAATALFSGLAAATYGGSVVTTTVTAYTTYCPEATTLTHGSSTITVTAATTLTLECPNGCTVTRPVYSTSKVVCPTISATPVSSIIGTAPYRNGTATIPATAPGPSSTATSTAPITPISSGSAHKAMSASGAGLAAAFGFAAFFL